MPQFEALALIAGTHRTNAETALQMVASDDVTAVLTHAKRKAIMLPQSRKAKLADAAERQILLERIMPLGTVIPFRPGAFLDCDDVGPLIAANRPMIERLFARLDGRCQFQITVEWTPENVLSHFKTRAELKPLFEAGVALPDALAGAVQHLADALANDMQSMLGHVARELILLPRSQDMLLNAVVLIDQDAQTALDQAVEAIDAIWTDGFKVRQIGPAPAASFAQLDPQLICNKDLIAAREVLAPADTSNEIAIAQARRLALLSDPAAAGVITRAAEVLCAGLANQDGGHFHLCHLLSEDQSAAPLPGREVA